MSNTQPDPATMTDRNLVDEYHSSDAEPGDARIEAILAEIERRNLDL